MNIFVEVTDIQWDIDGDDINDYDLATEMKVAIPTTMLCKIENNQDMEDDISEYVSDEISNRSGFCHTGFNIK